MFRGDEEVPDFMMAADLHQVANGNRSILEPAVDESIDFGKFAASALTRAVTSTYNIVPTVANWMGADMEELETDAVLKAFDDDLASYYTAHSQTVDVVGDVAAMFVPGMAGVKGVNYVQKALGGMERGTNVGKNMARSFGLLPSKGKQYATEAIAKMSDPGGTFRVLDANVLKAFGANYAQGVVEFAAFETAAAAVMEDSPLFENHSAKDVLVNAALGGSLVGGGIIGSITAAQTYGQLKRASDTLSKITAPFRNIKEAEAGSEDFVKYLQLKKERSNFPVPEETVTDPALLAKTTRLLEKRQRDIEVEMQTITTRMAGGDADIGAALHKSLDVLPEDKAWAAMLELKEAARLGKVTALETEALAATAKGKPTDVVVKYLKLWGDDAGSVYHTQPVVLGLTDMAKSEVEVVRDAAKRFSQQPVAGNKWTPVGQNHLDVEARYIVAFAPETKLVAGHPLSGTDLPFLERALHDKVNVVVDGMYMDTATLRNHIKDTKKKLADDLELYLDTDPTMNSAVAAKLLNVKQGVMEGKGYVAAEDSHFFARTPEDPITKPSAAKIVYRGDPGTAGVSGNVLSGMTRIKELQEAQHKVNLQAAAGVLGGETASKIPHIEHELVLSASDRGAGAGLLSMASGEYTTLNSIVEWIGKVTSEAKSKAHVAISEHFQAPSYKLLQNVDAQNELVLLRQAALSTGEKYVLVDGAGLGLGGKYMMLESVYKYRLKVMNGKQGVEPVIPKGVNPEIRINTEETWQYMKELVSHNDSYLQKEALLRNAMGKGMGSYEGVVYFPQPSSKNFPYFSFVVPKNPWLEEKTQMIWASTPEELARLEGSVPLEYRIIRKDDTEKFHKMMKDYDADRGMNSREIMSDIYRTGTAAPFIPKTNAQEVLQDILDHYKIVSDKQIRDAVTLQNNVAFSELRRMDAEFKAARASKKPFSGEAVGVTPYESYVKTALDIPRSSQVPVWTEFNNLAENMVSKVFNTMQGSWMKMKGEDDIAALNKHFEDNGYRGVKDALTEMVANHPADKKVLSKFVQAANGMFSTLILRTDPMHAATNGVGSLVLTGSETSYLTRMIKGSEEGQGFLRELSEVQLPGTAEFIKSPTKLITRAYGEFYKYLRGDPVAKAKFAGFEKNGWMPSMMDQIRSSLDAATLRGTETAGELNSKISSILKSTGNMLEKGAGNKFAEEMNRFVASHIAYEISEVGKKYAGLGEKEALAFINTFVNRTQGNYIASQRPLMFQGPIGQSISLFMTYQFNMMQHIFRHLSNEGGRKDAAILLGLQTSIFGMNGLPAFNFMNQHLVGNASGNTSHRDIHSTMMEIPAVGDWLLYGGFSNATGLGLYSRGDMNPRHATILPSNIVDIPFVSATLNTFGAIFQAGKEIAAGADVTSSFLRGIEHAGISRPLAGMSQALNGMMRDNETLVSTSMKGNVIYSQDLYSLATLGRIAGARPLDEAVMRDAYYRVQVYEGKDKAKLATLGAAIRDKVNSGAELDDSDVDDFMANYVASGGDQRNFIQYYQRQVKNAGKNQIKKLVERGNTPYGQYMQNLMIGLEADVEDLEN